MNPVVLDLPSELVSLIFSYLEGIVIAQSAAPTCVQWARISQCDQNIWKKRFEMEFRCNTDSHKEEYPTSWKQRYAKEWLWRNNKVEVKTLEGLAGHVIGVSYGDVEKSILGWSPDGIQKKWSLSTNKCMLTIHAARLISCVDFDESHVIVGCLDGRIELWAASTGQCEQVLLGHDNCVVCVKSGGGGGGNILSGSVDNTVRVWDKRTGSCKRVLAGHQGTVLCLACYADMVVSGSSDHTLRMWSMEQSADRDQAFEGSPHTVSCVDFQGDTVVSGAHDGTLRVWKASSMQREMALHAHEGVVTCVRVKGRRIVSGGSDCIVKVWDAVSKECVRRLEGHISYISCLLFDDQRVISGSNDGVIKVWDICPPALDC